MLLLAPTRELVAQTINVVTRLTIPFPRIVVSAVTGGEKRKSEKARLRKGKQSYQSVPLSGLLGDAFFSVKLRIDELVILNEFR